jgi:hypothetical protein
VTEEYLVPQFKALTPAQMKKLADQLLRSPHGRQAIRELERDAERRQQRREENAGPASEKDEAGHTEG